jgi:hypothetical protein
MIGVAISWDPLATPKLTQFSVLIKGSDCPLLAHCGCSRQRSAMPALK